MAAGTYGFIPNPTGFTVISAVNATVNYSVPAGKYAYISWSANFASNGGNIAVNGVNIFQNPSGLTGSIVSGNFYAPTGTTIGFISTSANNTTAGVVQLYNA